MAVAKDCLTAVSSVSGVYYPENSSIYPGCLELIESFIYMQFCTEDDGPLQDKEETVKRYQHRCSARYSNYYLQFVVYPGYIPEIQSLHDQDIPPQLLHAY